MQEKFSKIKEKRLYLMTPWEFVSHEVITLAGVSES